MTSITLTLPTLAVLALPFATPGCSTTRPPAETEVSVKDIIVKERATLFIQQVEARGLTVGPERVFGTLEGEGRNRRGACYRASVGTIVDPSSRRTVTYVALVDHDHIIERRRATPADDCDRDSFEELALPAPKGG